MPRKSAITVTDRSLPLKDRNAALARRLASGRIHGGGNTAVPLKEPQRWHTHIASAYLNDSRFYQMKENGWLPMTPDDLACKVEDSGFTLSPDGYLVRGPQGKEMLFKMAKDDYRLLEQAKTQQNMKGIGSASKVRTDVAEAASGQLGGEAADYLSKLSGDVVDTITGGEAA